MTHQINKAPEKGLFLFGHGVILTRLFIYLIHIELLLSANDGNLN
jgi:hypothetical protein